MPTRGFPEDRDPPEDMTSKMPLETDISGPLASTTYKERDVEATSQASTSPLRSPQNPITPSLSRSCSDIDLSAIREAVDQLTATQFDDEHMFRALEDIFRNAQDYERSINPEYGGTENLWSHLRNADLASERGKRDIQALRIVQQTLSQMVWNESRLIVVAARTLADAARDPTWRLPFGESGILDLFSQILGNETISDELAVHSLRLIGNSCSDTDENRARVVDGDALSLIVLRLANSRLVAVAVPVLFNICADFEPAHQRARDNSLGATLIHLFHQGHLGSSPLRSYACRLLDICNEDFPVNESPSFAAEALLLVASAPDVDVVDRASLVEAATQHLRVERFQQHIVNENLIQIPLQLLLQTCLRVSRSNTSGSDRSTPPARDTEDEEQLAILRASLVDALSELSALRGFATQHEDLNSPIVMTLVEWLSGPHSQLELCACLMLGNLARSDNVCRDMIAQYAIHTSLISLVRVSSNPQVLHAALGFLRNLGLLVEHKEILGRAGVIEATARFWKADSSPQVTQAAISLIRQVVKDSIFNTRSMLGPLSPDPESPAHSRTNLSLLLLLFSRLDDVSAKMEIARLVAAVLRCVHSGSDPSMPRDQLQTQLFALHPDIAQPLAMMVTQSRWPIIRSEGWFALALAARSPQGAASVDAVLKHGELFVALQSTIRGESTISEGSASPLMSQSQVDAMKAKDRQNATILIHEFLENTKTADETFRRRGSVTSLDDRDVNEIFDDQDSARRTALEDLLGAAVS